MSCALEFPESFASIYFCDKKNKQNVLIDILTKYGDIDINTLATTLGVSIQTLDDICHQNDRLTGDKADGLAQLFLLFLAATKIFSFYWIFNTTFLILHIVSFASD